jgi:Gas vesicle synthesis protein GvpL/GvpF
VSAGTATYLYGLTRPLPAGALVGVRGIGGGAVRALVHDRLACVVSTVGLDDFGAEVLPHRLENLGWLERVAREHDDVVRDLATMTTTVPLRLATLCADDTSARDRLRDLQEETLRLLETLDDREEWGVKIFAESGDDPRDSSDEPALTGARAQGGAEYLRRRRAQLGARADRAAKAVADAEAVFADLSSYAVQVRRHRPQDPQLSGVPAPMLLNAAFLVDRSAAGAFGRAVAAIAGARTPGRVVITGPWPPYSFATPADR